MLKIDTFLSLFFSFLHFKLKVMHVSKMIVTSARTDAGALNLSIVFLFEFEHWAIQMITIANDKWIFRIDFFRFFEYVHSNTFNQLHHFPKLSQIIYTWLKLNGKFHGILCECTKIWRNEMNEKNNVKFRISALNCNYNCFLSRCNIRCFQIFVKLGKST